MSASGVGKERRRSVSSRRGSVKVTADKISRTATFWGGERPMPKTPREEDGKKPTSQDVQNLVECNRAILDVRHFLVFDEFGRALVHEHIPSFHFSASPAERYPPPLFSFAQLLSSLANNLSPSLHSISKTSLWNKPPTSHTCLRSETRMRTHKRPTKIGRPLEDYENALPPLKEPLLTLTKRFRL